MRLAGALLVGSLCLLVGCGSDEDKGAAAKPDLTPEQQNELRELEAQVKLLEQERLELFEKMPTMQQLEQTRHDLEDRKTRIEALTQRDKVIPCLVAELARVVSEGTSIDVVEISAEGVVIELPVADGSKFERQLNACGALGTSKKIDGGWAWEAKMLPVEPPPRETSQPTGETKRPPSISVLGQLPADPLRRLESLRSVAEAIGKENIELRKKKQDMDRLVEQKDGLVAAERSLKSPPDVPGTVKLVEDFGKQAGVELKQVRPESGNKLVRLHVELSGRLLDVDALFVKLQTRPVTLVVETLVLKPGNGEQAVPVHMTLASPRL